MRAAGPARTRVALCLAGATIAAPAAIRGEETLSYEFTVRAADPPAVEISLDVRGRDTGETAFALCEDWHRMSTCQERVLGFTVHDSKGRALALDAPEPRIRVVRHAPRETLRASYRLRSDETAGGSAPLTRPDFFQVLGHSLASPAHLRPSDRHRFRARWRGLKRAGWSAASSFGLGERARYEGTLQDFRHSLWVAGRLRLLSARVRRAPVHVAVAGDDWGFSDLELQRLLLTLVTEMRGLMDDWDHPPLLVAVAPWGEKKPGSTSMTGSGFVNAFSLLLTPGSTLQVARGHGADVLRFLAHEMFHQWTGRRIPEDEPERAGEWFFEGFTDYYARRLLRRTGLIDTAAAVGDLNRVLARYWLNPFRNVKGVEAVYGREQDLEHLSYQRGDIVAVLLDAEIRRTSAGRKSLDDVMRAVLVEALRTRTGFDTERLLRIFTGDTSPAFVETLRRVVVDGETPVLGAPQVGPCLQAGEQRLGRFELGFDFQASRQSGVVAGVVPGSAAHAAGLRDGQKLLGWSFGGSDPATPVELRVDGGEGPRRLSYLPNDGSVSAPRLSLAPDAACRDVP